MVVVECLENSKDWWEELCIMNNTSYVCVCVCLSFFGKQDVCVFVVCLGKISNARQDMRWYKCKKCRQQQLQDLQTTTVQTIPSAPQGNIG